MCTSLWQKQCCIITQCHFFVIIRYEINSTFSLTKYDELKLRAEERAESFVFFWKVWGKAIEVHLEQSSHKWLHFVTSLPFPEEEKNKNDKKVILNHFKSYIDNCVGHVQHAMQSNLEFIWKIILLRRLTISIKSMMDLPKSVRPCEWVYKSKFDIKHLMFNLSLKSA